MKYFEVNDPYFALIKADNDEVAQSIYNDMVAETEDGSDMKEVSQERAFELIDKAYLDDETDREQLKNEIGLVLVDGNLI